MGASARNTTVQCSGAFSVVGKLVLQNLTIAGCKNCQFDTVIRAASGQVLLKNVTMTKSSLSCGKTGSVRLQGVTITDISHAAFVGGSCSFIWSNGFSDGELSVAGSSSQANITDTRLPKIRVSSGEDSTVRLLRVTSDLEFVSDPISGFAKVIAIDCVYPSGAPTVEKLRGAYVDVGEVGASCDETCAESGASCDGDSLAGIISAETLRQLLAGTNATCGEIVNGFSYAHPTVSNMCRNAVYDDFKCTLGSRLFRIYGQVGPIITDCSQSQCGAGSRCVNRKSFTYEDVSSGRPANSSSHSVVGQIFDRDNVFIDGQSSCSSTFNRSSFEQLSCFKVTSTANTGHVRIFVDDEIIYDGYVSRANDVIVDECFSSGSKLYVQGTHHDGWDGFFTKNGAPMGTCKSCTLTTNVATCVDTNLGCGAATSKCDGGQKCELNVTENVVFLTLDKSACLERCREDVSCAAAIHGVRGGTELCFLTEDASLTTFAINLDDWTTIDTYFKVTTALKKGNRTLEECQRLCRRESTCIGMQINSNDNSCELLVDSHCDFETAFAATGGQWTVQSRATFDPELHRDAAKAVLPLSREISTSHYFQHRGNEEKWWKQWWGVKLARVSVDPHIIIFLRDVGGFGGDIDVWLATTMPQGGTLWMKPDNMQPCAQLRGVANWDTEEVVCEGRGTHLIITPADENSQLMLARVVVKAPKILGTFCMDSDTLYVSPDGSDDNKGEDPSKPLATIQHAVNMASDSGTTIRLGPAQWRHIDQGVMALPTSIFGFQKQEHTCGKHYLTGGVFNVPASHSLAIMVEGLHIRNSYTATDGATIFLHSPINVTGCTFTNNNGPNGVSDIFYSSTSQSETGALLLENNHFDRTGGVVVGVPRSCADDSAVNGITTIYPLLDWYPKIEVRCDLHSSGGPWTTFQRRVDTTSFGQDWDAYFHGFSNTEKGKDGSFWLGNNVIKVLTKGGAKLRVDLCTLAGGSETSHELFESSKFERPEKWKTALEGAKSNGYVKILDDKNSSSVEEAMEHCESHGLRLCTDRNEVSKDEICGNRWTASEVGWWGADGVQGFNFTSTGNHEGAGIAQRVKHIPNDVNFSYGPVTYRFEVEGMSVTGSHYLLVRPVHIFGTDGLNDKVTKTQSLPIGTMGNVSVEFTAPVWIDNEREDVGYWYVGVFQSGIKKKATMLLRRMSLKIVKDCVAVEYSDFNVAAESSNLNVMRLSVGGDFMSTSAKMAPQGLEESSYKHFEAFTPCDIDDFNGWHVAAVIDGSKSTWNYDSNLWTGTSTFDDGNERKTQAFNHLMSDRIRVKFEGLDDRVDCVQEFMYAHNLSLSLREIFAGGAKEGLSPGRQTWINMGCGDFATQSYCNSHGFNVVTQHAKSRFGILFNNEQHCQSPDAGIGFGIQHTNPNLGSGTYYGTVSLSAGGSYGCCSNGGIHEKQPVRAIISVASTCFAANMLQQFPRFRFPFMEMKLQPKRLERYTSNILSCSEFLCAGRCINRTSNMGVWCLPASPKNIWVSPTGSDDLNNGISAPLATIQLAIFYTDDGDTVELLPGIYVGGADCTTFTNADGFYGATKRRCNYNNDFMGKKITVDGHGHAVIDCQATSFGDLPKRGFIFANGETRETVLRECESDYLGGGALRTFGASLSIHQLKFTSNKVVKFSVPYQGGVFSIEDSGHIDVVRCTFSNSMVPSFTNGTDLSIHPHFTGTVKVTDSKFNNSVFDPNSRIQNCSASDVCTVGNKSGTCANSNVGVNCYGCRMNNDQYGCQELRVTISAVPDTFVEAGTQTLAITVPDLRCDLWQLKIDTKEWLSTANPVIVPELPVGSHTVSVRALCPGSPPVFSKPTNASWKVVDGRPTNTSITGPVLTKYRSPTFTLGANKDDCNYTYSLDNGPVLTKEVTTTGSLTAQWLGKIPENWPHSRGTVAFSSSMGIGTHFEVKMDGQSVGTVVATGGAEARVELQNLEEGRHDISVIAEAGGKRHKISSSFFMKPNIDTQIFGGPVHDYAFFKLKSIGENFINFEYKLNSGSWMQHEDQKLLLGPLTIGRYELLVRAVTNDGQKDPVPARFIWSVDEAVEVQLEMPPLDTKAGTSHVAVKGSDLSFSIDGGTRHEGAPKALGPLSPGDHTLRVWSGKEPAPLLSSWVQEKTPAFGRMDVSVAVNETGWHRIHAKATDPLGMSDPMGAYHRFFADFESPVALLELPSLQRENRATAFVNCTDNFECGNKLTASIDGGVDLETTRDAFDTGELMEGTHEIRLWAHDRAGNKQIQPTVVVMEIDQTPPPEPTMRLVVRKKTIVASIYTDSSVYTGSWQLEYKRETSCGVTFILDPKWSGLLQSQLVIGSIDDPLLARTYRLKVTLQDKVKNEAQYFSETARVVGEALPRPKITRLNASALNISASIAKVDVQWSTDELFKSAVVETRKSQESPIIIVLDWRLVDTIVFVRVSEPDSNSWSVPTKAWTTTTTCPDSQYLDETSDNLADWQCQDCPDGAYCVGPFIWSDVVAKFGFWRVPGPAPQQFRMCLLPSSCLGAPNPDLYNRYYDGEREETKDMARFDWWNASGQPESCNEDWGFQQRCEASTCRLCSTCRPGFKRKGLAGCSKCPETGANRAMLVLGILAVLLGGTLIVYLSIRTQGATQSVSETAKKIMVNYLQVVSIASLFPMRWPGAVQTFFEAQAAISSASKSLLSPACELSYMRAAQAFYQIQVGFATLPVLIVMICTIFWGVWSRCRYTEIVLDRLIASVVVLLYLTYPTLAKQSMAGFACEKVGGALWLAEDLQERCYEGTHMAAVLLLSVPQILLYTAGLPLAATVLLYRNRERLSEAKMQFRWGLLYAGFRPSVWWWELSIVVRKVSMIFVGGVFGFHLKPDMQIHTSLLLIALMVVAHLVAMPFAELTPRHHILHWIELASLVVCFMTLHSGTIFFIGEDQGRISHANLTALSVFVVSGNALFTMYLAFVYFRALYKDSRERRLEAEMSHASPEARTETNYEPGKSTFANPMCEGSGVEMTVINDSVADNQEADQRQPSKQSDLTILPDHWEAFHDHQTGDTYYYNHQTGESQWEPPV
eukprot:g3443.t1